MKMTKEEKTELYQNIIEVFEEWWYQKKNKNEKEDHRFMVMIEETSLSITKCAILIRDRRSNYRCRYCFTYSDMKAAKNDPECFFLHFVGYICNHIESELIKMEEKDMEITWNYRKDLMDATSYAYEELMRLQKINTHNPFDYEKVIFNDPATIVIWSDGTKTVVKCQPEDVFDPEKGLALCYMKKALANKGSFNRVLKREVSKYYEEDQTVVSFFQQLGEELTKKWDDALKEIQRVEKPKKN